MRILVVEDDRKAARLLAKGLQEEGFLVDVAHSAEDGDLMVDGADYAAIVLDWLLPGTDGATLCHDLRARGVTTPILMLTARRDLDDRVRGLNVGADDYLTKPYAFAELVARLRAVLRRSALSRPPVLTVDDLSLDPLSHEVRRAGAPVALTPKEYALLEVLMRHAGDVMTRAALGERLWRGDDDVNNVVDVHISHLRKKIDRDPLPPLIHTVWGRGYRLGPSRR
jgi:DNA-binding response OmpR family regulator